MRGSEDIVDLLEKLREARRLYESRDSVLMHFCVDCRRVVHLVTFRNVEIDELKEHANHKLVLQCYDHAGIDEWIEALTWVLG